MTRMLGPPSHAGSIIQPEASPLGLSPWNLETLPAPDALDPLVVHPPALVPQERRDAPVPIAPVKTGQLGDSIGKPPLIIAQTQRAPLR